MVIVNFIRDPEVGIFARVKRLEKGTPLSGQATPNESCSGSEKD